MTTTEQHVPTAAERIREAAAALARHRGGPCLVFVSRSLVHADVLTVRTALGSARGDHLDVIVAGPGGVSEAAYLLARELRRRFAQLTAYVPFEAKSAATLLCLAADELVLGDLGELGPLDQQYEEKQTADYPLSTSRLLPGVALRQLQDGATACYDALVRRIVKESGLRPLEAGSKAAELVGVLYAPLVQQLDPARLAECARGLAVGKAYAERVLRRYRPALWAESGPQLLDRLVQDYADPQLCPRSRGTRGGGPPHPRARRHGGGSAEPARPRADRVRNGRRPDRPRDWGRRDPHACGRRFQPGAGTQCCGKHTGRAQVVLHRRNDPNANCGTAPAARGGSAVCGDCGRVRAVPASRLTFSPRHNL